MNPRYVATLTPRVFRATQYEYNDNDNDDGDNDDDDIGRETTAGATERGAHSHALRIVTHSHNCDASPDRFLAQSTSSTSSSSSLWRTTRFSSTMFTSSARLSASEYENPREKEKEREEESARAYDR